MDCHCRKKDCCSWQGCGKSLPKRQEENRPKYFFGENAERPDVSPQTLVMIIFKYKKESLGFGKGKVKRPVADVYLKSRSNNSWLEFHPYIDSGADLTMIPLSLGKLIGFKIDSGKVEQIDGIRGSVPVIYTQAQIRIGEQEMLINVAWALSEEVPPLLGRLDIFDRFEVTFRQKRGEIIFVPFAK
jgi:hypothetical protein